MGPFPQCRALGLSRKLTPWLLPRANACKYTKLLQGRGSGMEGLNMVGKEAELPQCHPSSVLLWRSQVFVKCGAR